MENLTFTRYLYPKLDVKQSLLIALLERKSDEALFWAYEIYFSGFEEDIFDYIDNIYLGFYKIENPELEVFIKENREYWKMNKNDYVVGSIIMTFSLRNYQICEFIKEYIGEPCFTNIQQTKMRKFLVKFSENDLIKYKTVLPNDGNARYYLKNVCKYPIRRKYNEFFGIDCLDYRDAFYYNWEYYAAKSPIWMTRIKEQHGIINNETKKVEFPNDELFEAFYDKWQLEPDEQSLDLQEKCIGNSSCKQLPKEDFYENFGGIKRELKNSIIYMV
uniref:Uncharacterized protein n=1 Tax=viral metagenome TaxID=1070528 RepID=A0A6C0JL89_9ZZZZ